MEDQIITTNELLDKNSAISLKTAKEFCSSTFWYYTSLKTANLILDNHCFHCRNFTEMNDKREADLHGEESQFIHALCFCNSNTEKIPMWYLYSGITGNGASIGITPATMIKFINSIQTVKNAEGTVELVRDKDFELKYGWVYYRKADKTAINYRRTWYRIDDTALFEKDNYFIKDYPWEYEKEFRIVIKNKTNIPYDKLVINFPDDLYKSLKIKLAPEITELSFVDLAADLRGFHKLLSKKLMHSELSIKMDLCQRNKNEIIEHFSELVDAENALKICAAIRSIHHCNSDEDI